MRLFDSCMDYDALGNPIPSRGCAAADVAIDPPPGGESDRITSITYEYEGPGLACSADAEFVGKYSYDQYDYDVDAGYFDEKARCYDPAQGRWLSEDPMGFDAGDTNLFRYHNPGQGRLLPEE